MIAKLHIRNIVMLTFCLHALSGCGVSQKKGDVLPDVEGTAIVLSYADYDNATWIVHSDTSHGGRQLFWLKRYDGGENIVDEFGLGAEYWDSPDGKYDENSTFTYRNEEISMSEYEELRKEIFGW